MNLDDACRLRSNELTRILAGCVGINPVWTLPKLEKLKEDAFTDINAYRFILAVKEKMPELLTTDDNMQSKIVVQVASKNNLLSDFLLWITTPTNLYRDAPAAIKELQALAVTQNTIIGLQDWIKTCEELNQWR